MKTFKIQLQNIFNRQTATEIYHHFSLIWSITFKIIATVLVTNAVTFYFAFLYILENSNPTAFPEFYNTLLVASSTSTKVASSILLLMALFFALKFVAYLLLRRNQEHGGCLEKAK